MSPDASTPPSAPDLSGDADRSWPRRHPWPTAAIGLVLVAALGFAVLGPSSDPPADVAEVAAPSPTDARTPDVTPSPEPSGTATATPATSDTATATPEPSETVTAEREADDAPTSAPPEPAADPDPAPEPAETAASTSDPEPVETSSGPPESGDQGGDARDGGGRSDGDVSAILEVLWDDLSQQQRDLACVGWRLDPEQSLDTLMAAAGGVLTRAQARDFLDRTC